ncbi:hypothetical protein [Bradyrhizobium manausense]|nr:hypothetical protein [Bradyrhizobium manausense]
MLHFLLILAALSGLVTLAFGLTAARVLVGTVLVATVVAVAAFVGYGIYSAEHPASRARSWADVKNL